MTASAAPTAPKTKMRMYRGLCCVVGASGWQAHDCWWQQASVWGTEPKINRSTPWFEKTEKQGSHRSLNTEMEIPCCYGILICQIYVHSIGCIRFIIYIRFHFFFLTSPCQGPDALVHELEHVIALTQACCTSSCSRALSCILYVASPVCLCQCVCVCPCVRVQVC